MTVRQRPGLFFHPALLPSSAVPLVSSHPHSLPSAATPTNFLSRSLGKHFHPAHRAVITSAFANGRRLPIVWKLIPLFSVCSSGVRQMESQLRCRFCSPPLTNAVCCLLFVPPFFVKGSRLTQTTPLLLLSLFLCPIYHSLYAVVGVI